MRYITPDHCVGRRLEDRPAPKWAAGVLVFRGHPHSRQVLEAFDNVRPVRYPLLYNLTSSDFEPFVFEADVVGRTIVIVTRCVWGGPQAAILVEELAYLGVPLIVGYGVAGGLDPDLRQGSIVVADVALPTDGTSRAYGATSRLSPDVSLVETAIETARGIDCDLRPVTAATVDALYRETEELVEDLRGQGAQIVNLETSTLYATAGVCNVRSLWLGYVSDCLSNGEWDDWFADLSDVSRRTVQVCRRLLADLLER